MAKYDDASWHYGGDYPKDLPKENSATHIGLFLTWCIDNNLMSKEQIEDNEEDIEKVKNREITGAEFLMKNCDEKFCTSDLSKIGQKFANAYYEDKSKFAKEIGDYFGDYARTFNIKVVDGYLDQNSLYRIENSWDNYELIKGTIDKRFQEWKDFKPKASDRHGLTTDRQ